MSLYRKESDKSTADELKKSDEITYRNSDGHLTSGKIVDTIEENHKGFTMSGKEFTDYTTKKLVIQTPNGPSYDSISSSSNRVYRQIK